jgi:hypothetical protein
MGEILRQDRPLLNGIVGMTHGLPPAAINMNAVSGGTWPSANRALFIPWYVQRPVVVTALQVYVTTSAAGNLDLGVYDANGVRLVSTGSTAVAAVGVQRVAVSPTSIPAGKHYLAMSCSTTSAQFLREATQPWTFLTGVQQMAAAVPLPASATFAAPANNYSPLILAHGEWAGTLI